jgi:3-oxoacyl-[acyl-carrier protein] reductase
MPLRRQGGASESAGARVDQVLVNNANFIHDDAVFPCTAGAMWQRVLDVSLNGFSTSPSRSPYMIRTRWGRIISITSVAVAGNRGASQLFGRQRSAARGRKSPGA